MPPPPKTASEGSDLLSSYRANPGFYDEFLDSEQGPRAHWQKIAGALQAIDSESWLKRRSQLQRLVRENGMTFNVYSDNEEREDHWALDMLPLVLSENETREIESALSQRATLLNIILSDVYGRQTLLQTARMHPHLIYANPSFLRPCHGLLGTRERHLRLYAADLTRGSDGKWWVLADKVQSAAGLGYALENRMLMSRIFPKVMRDTEIESLQPFMQAFTREVESAARSSESSPRIALLTRGPSDPSFFEHSYLARHLGYTLAEGADLIVRDNRLYMKTIGGAQRIDVMLRRIPSEMADPLELRNESLIGIPGLVNAVRQKNLSLVNALGSSFVESTAMLSFLPWFCRNYLGENLEMPSVATWWCGQAKEREHVIDKIDTLAIKPTFWGAGQSSYFGPNLSEAEKVELIAKIRHRPENYCGQQILSSATVPVYNNGAIEPRGFKMRVFLTATPEGWKMMPGGLLRYAASQNDLVVWPRQSGSSKDVWVPRSPGQAASRPSAATTLRQSLGQRSSSELPSRTAENLFWLGRYLERADGLARVLRSLLKILAEEASGGNHLPALPFLSRIVPPDSSPEDYQTGEAGQLDLEATESTILYATLDTQNIESLASNLNSIQNLALKVKERLSSDTWESISRLKILFEETHTQAYTLSDDRIIELLDDTLHLLSRFVGNLMENTVRSQGWNFLEIGRRIERAASITFMLESAFEPSEAIGEQSLSSLIEWADSSITYRRRYLNQIGSAPALEVLCFDPTNPRSLAFQTEQLHGLVMRLPHARSTPRHPIDQTSLRLYSQVSLGDPNTLSEPGQKTGEPASLAPFLQGIREELFSLAEGLEQHYFAHTNQAAEQKPRMNLG